MPQISCRYCYKAELRPSRSHGIIDQMMKVLGRRPVRCPGCNRRYYVPRT